MTTTTAPPRRLLMTVDAVGGVWRYAMALAAALKVAGLDTVFLGFGPGPSPAQRAEAERIGTLHWHSAPLDWMIRQEQDLDPTVPTRIADLAARSGAELVHLNMPGQAVGLDTRLPVVVAVHSTLTGWFAAVHADEVPPEWQWQVARERRGLTRADAIVVPSRSMAVELHLAHGDLGTVTLVRNGTLVAERPATGARLVVAAARWWDEGKNAIALDEVAQDLPWPVAMAGPLQGPNGEKVEILHADHRGTLDHAETLGLMRQAGVFVSPSLYEPFGLAALEAARCGLPLVLSDIPTYRELWDTAAVFFKPNDEGALSGALRRLLDAPALRRDLGAAALRRAAEYTVTTQVAGTLRVYRSRFAT